MFPKSTSDSRSATVFASIGKEETTDAETHACVMPDRTHAKHRPPPFGGERTHLPRPSRARPIALSLFRPESAPGTKHPSTSKITGPTPGASRNQRKPSPMWMGHWHGSYGLSAELRRGSALAAWSKPAFRQQAHAQGTDQTSQTANRRPFPAAELARWGILDDKPGNLGGQGRNGKTGAVRASSNPPTPLPAPATSPRRALRKAERRVRPQRFLASENRPNWSTPSLGSTDRSAERRGRGRERPHIPVPSERHRRQRHRPPLRPPPSPGDLSAG
jgi:hypothetical protein